MMMLPQQRNPGSMIVKNLNSSIVNAKPRRLRRFSIPVRKKLKISSNRKSGIKKNGNKKNQEVYTKLYVKNLDKGIMTETILKQLFSRFGEIKKIFLPKLRNGTIKGFAIVNFRNPQHAKRAQQSMHRTQIGLKFLHVTRAQKKTERQRMMTLWKYKNVFVKNINKNVNEDALKKFFSRCGKIVSTKITRNRDGKSKGSGLVCFSKPEDGSKAISKLNGAMFHQKPLLVTLAQSKKERKMYLEMLRHYQNTVGISKTPPLKQQQQKPKKNKKKKPVVHQYGQLQKIAAAPRIANTRGKNIVAPLVVPRARGKMYSRI